MGDRRKSGVICVLEMGITVWVDLVEVVEGMYSGFFPPVTWGRGRRLGPPHLTVRGATTRPGTVSWAALAPSVFSIHCPQVGGEGGPYCGPRPHFIIADGPQIVAIR